MNEFAVIISIHLKPDKTKEFLRLLRRCRSTSKRSPGCAGLPAGRDPEETLSSIPKPVKGDMVLAAGSASGQYITGPIMELALG